MKSFIVLGLLFFIQPIVGANESSIVIVGHISAPKINSDQAAQIFLGKIRRFPNGNSVIPIDLPEDEDIRDSFYYSLTNRSPVKMKAYWSRLIFTGGGRPPVTVDDSDAVVDLISENPEMIGYISKSEVNSSVIVLLEIQSR